MRRFLLSPSSRSVHTQGVQSLHQRPVQHHYPPRGHHLAEISYSQTWAIYSSLGRVASLKQRGRNSQRCCCSSSYTFSVPSLGKRETLRLQGMSSIFEAYDEEFLALTQDIGNNISHLTTYETDSGGWHGASTSCVCRLRAPRCCFSLIHHRTPSTFISSPSLRR